LSFNSLAFICYGFAPCKDIIFKESRSGGVLNKAIQAVSISAVKKRDILITKDKHEKKHVSAESVAAASGLHVLSEDQANEVFGAEYAALHPVVTGRHVLDGFADFGTICSSSIFSAVSPGDLVRQAHLSGRVAWTAEDFQCRRSFRISSPLALAPGSRPGGRRALQEVTNRCATLESLHDCSLDTPDSVKSLGKQQEPDTWKKYAEYPLSITDFRRSAFSFADGENRRRLEAAVARALRPVDRISGRAPVRVFVVGTSMTAGVACVSPCGTEGRGCAWPARLAAALGRLLDGSDGASCIGGGEQRNGFEVTNTANHGLSSAYLATFGVESSHDFGDMGTSADIIIVDNAVNDGLHSGLDSTTDGRDKLRHFSEVLIRMLLLLPSSPGIIYLATFTGNQQAPRTSATASYVNDSFKQEPCAGREAQDAYRTVTSHYGVPIVSFRDVASLDETGSCRDLVGAGFGHPPWRVQQLVADVVAHYFLTSLQQASSASAAALGTSASPQDNHLLPSPIIPEDDVDSATLCAVRMGRSNVLELRPALSTLDPEETVNTRGTSHGRKIHILQGAGWNCFDDRTDGNVAADNGRPGWISQAPGSIIKIQFQTSEAGAVGISFLRSYEGFSGVRVEIDGKSYSLHQELGRNNLKKRLLPSIGTEPRRAPPGTINALWGQPYSLPALWVVRRLPAGNHTLALELLPFNSPAILGALSGDKTRKGGSADYGGDDKGKFKLLKLVSC